METRGIMGMVVAPQEVAALQRRRQDECRLSAGLALETFDDAAAFLDDRGMLTRTPDCSLPSVFAACQEEPYRTGGKGFAGWPATKWWWAGALEATDGVTVLKVHNGKNLLLSPRVLQLADPICRAELDRLVTQPIRSEEDRLTRRLLDHLAEAGPSSSESVQVELNLHSRALRSLRHPLERCGALVSRQAVVPTGGGHLHTAELCRYDQLVPTPLVNGLDPFEAFEELVVAGVRAAVLAPERELIRWFSWRWYARTDLVERLLSDGRLVRIDDGLVALG
jgi:hypothetical protein